MINDRIVLIGSKSWTQAGTTTPGWQESGSNGNDEVLHIPQSSGTGTSPLDSLVSESGHSLVLPLCRNAVSMIQRNQQGGRRE